jgi:AcrR family transcriptional regulator
MIVIRRQASGGNTTADMATKDMARQAILETAMDLFDRFGPAKTSVADIARCVGMSPANIYNFYPSRDAIIEAVGEVNLTTLKLRIMADAEHEPEHWNKIRILFLRTAEHLWSHLQNEKDILYLQLLERKYQWRFVCNFHQFLRDTAQATLSEGIAKGCFRPMDAKSAMLVLFDCMTGALDPLSIVRFYGADHQARFSAQLDLLEHAFRCGG